MTLTLDKIGHVALLAAALVLPATNAQAMSVSPMHLEMTSAGKARVAQIRVTNESTIPMPVEAKLETLSLTETGDMKRKPTKENLLIIPPQAMIAPGGSQIFRVQWVGEPSLQRSQSYLLSLSQIPVKMPKGQTAVQIVASMGVMINVAPLAGKPELRIVETDTIVDKSGKRRALVVVENNSPVHGLIEKANIILSAGSFSKSYSAQELGSRLGIGLVQPGKRRRFIMPDALPTNVKTVDASLTYQAGK